jgi:hypothetical protein
MNVQINVQAVFKVIIYLNQLVFLNVLKDTLMKIRFVKNVINNV